MDLHILIPRQWPGLWTRVIIIVVIFLFVTRRAPDAVLPLGLGGWLGGWIARAPARGLPVSGVQGSARCP
jgi:hypothetical protein